MTKNPKAVHFGNVEIREYPMSECLFVTLLQAVVVLSSCRFVLSQKHEEDSPTLTAFLLCIFFFALCINWLFGWILCGTYYSLLLSSTKQTKTKQKQHTVLGNNPSAGIGAPVELDWEYSEGKIVSISEDEEDNNNNKRRHKNKSPREFYLNYYQRIKIAESAGFSKKDFDKAEKQVQWSQAKRKVSSFQSFPLLWIKSWKVQFATYKNKKFINKYRKEHSIGHGTKKKWEQKLPS